MPPVVRDPGPRRRLLLVAALTLLAGWAGWSLATHLWNRSRPPAPAAPAAATFDRIYLRDVEQSQYEGGEKVWSLAAAEIVHRKRKLGPLTINPVKEVEMTGVRIEIDLRGAHLPGMRAPDGSLDLPVRSILEKTLAAKDLGFVSRLLVRQFDLRLLDGEKPAFGIQAAAVSVGIDPGRLRFDHGVTVTGRAGERLDTDEAEWRSADRRLVVKGAFRFEDANGSREGRGGRFRIGADGGLVSD